MKRPGYPAAAAAAFLLAFAAARAAGAEPDPAPVLQPFEGFGGVWLTNATAEVFVAAEPYPRVAVFRRRGGVSPFRRGDRDPYVGLMTWVKAPGQTADSARPANRPAELTRAGPLEARLAARADPELALRVEMHVLLDERAPRLRVRHGVSNLGPEERELAVWAVAALPRAGTVLVPFAGDGRSPAGQLHVWDGVIVNQPGVEIGDRGFTLDLSASYRGRTLRLGVPGPAGWIAYVRDGLAARAAIAVDAAALYPERGTTGAVFAETGGGPLAGMEQVGPLRRVAPGATAWLEQEWELLGDRAVPATLADAQLRSLLDPRGAPAAARAGGGP